MQCPSYTTPLPGLCSSLHMRRALSGSEQEDLQVVDTVELFHFKRQRKLSLRFLSAYLLHEKIQQGTHDSVVDARTALALFQVCAALSCLCGACGACPTAERCFVLLYAAEVVPSLHRCKMLCACMGTEPCRQPLVRRSTRSWWRPARSARSCWTCIALASSTAGTAPKCHNGHRRAQCWWAAARQRSCLSGACVGMCN